MTENRVQAPTNGALANHRAPSYEVSAEYVIAPSSRLFRAGWKGADKIRRMPSTPQGATVVVVVPPDVDYVYLATSGAIADLVREAGRVIVRGGDPTAVQMLEHQLRRATRTWSE